MLPLSLHEAADRSDGLNEVLCTVHYSYIIRVIIHKMTQCDPCLGSELP